MSDEYDHPEAEDAKSDNPTAEDHECQFCHESFDTEAAVRDHVEAEHASVENPSEEG
ncbi:hypothetical protein SAMN04487947_3239 [Halogeometricum rufum]|uniref:C2H2-type domain-containing protein n=1 Tax=Halogeometricum rufum TaxID=553469 RepID=A0A1I6IGR5_9EURY|nr:hypothetical protein [Halogeometricum rufum]SFR65987.1 hypothetical protein SAMN04487947_3239 [Halogeometricum rufum]